MVFARASTSPKALKAALETCAARGQVVLVDRDPRRFLAATVMAALRRRAITTLDRFHGEHSEADGLPREALRQRLGVPHEKTFARVLTALVEGHEVELEKDLVRLPGRGRAFSEAAGRLRAELMKRLRDAGLQPPLVGDLAARVQAPEARVLELLQALVAEGLAVRAQELFFDAQAIAALEVKLVDFLSTNPAITTQQFKELTGLTRKFLIPLAEYFDARKVTLRVGEARVLRGRGST
jgi:selenocysteine-specific elongation factor